jgi:hypothetical protein
MLETGRDQIRIERVSIHAHGNYPENVFMVITGYTPATLRVRITVCWTNPGYYEKISPYPDRETVEYG